MHERVFAAQSQPEAAGFILRCIKGISVAIGSVIAAIVCAVIAATKGRSPLGWAILVLIFSILTLMAAAGGQALWPGDRVGRHRWEWPGRLCCR